MFPNYKQNESADCGPTCLRIVSKYYGKLLSLNKVNSYNSLYLSASGINLSRLSDIAENLGFRTIKGRISFDELNSKRPFPCIIHWEGNHFVVLYKIKKNYIYISDPVKGLIKYKKNEFIKSWCKEKNTGIALLLEPSINFHNTNSKEKENPIDYKYFLRSIVKHKKFVYQIIFGMIAGFIFQLITPFLTQSVVDIGIKNQDIDFIYLILIAQLTLFFSSSAIDFIRSWIFLHFSTRVSISLISDFFIKLMSLPISYFDTKKTGDILQRIGDNSRIQGILMGSPLNVLFSIINLFVFSIILGFYSSKILLIFIVGTTLHVAWILIFLKKRKNLDELNFSENSKVNSKVIELINGIQDIKLNNSEKQQRWEWESLQLNLFKLSKESLILSQTQGVGAIFINQTKNIFISIFTAQLVIQGDLTLGMMMAVSYIIGQVNAPVSQLIGLIHTVQDAKISLDRLNEIYLLKSEIDDSKNFPIPSNSEINIDRIDFKYPGFENYVLKDVSMTIPYNKVTAIVGASGSGKTTLMKLILKNYNPTKGDIKIGTTSLKNISPYNWREYCGIVTDSGYIFNNSIEKNITIGDETPDYNRLIQAVEIACIREYIESLPHSYETKLGIENGQGLSSGQRQRLLIARAIYKNPSFICFDEATSALDAVNEKEIVSNLKNFFLNKTVLIIAHRLSTIKNADQIVVLIDGEIKEIGNHKELVAKKGQYFNLVKDQLELGKLI